MHPATLHAPALAPAPVPASAEMCATPEGHALARPLLLPNARRFEEVLAYHGEWNAAPPVDPHPLGRALSKGNRLGPYCTIDLSQVGGRPRRSLMVTPTDSVVDALRERIVIEGDELDVRIVAHAADANRALVIANHNRIIGSHWLADIDPATIPSCPYTKRDAVVSEVYADLEREARRPVIYRRPDATIELRTTPAARTPIQVHSDGHLTGRRIPANPKPEAAEHEPLTLFAPDAAASAPAERAPGTRVRRTKIPRAALEVLERCRVDGNAVFLPEELERSAYEAVNKALVALGGKWSRKRRAHEFPAGEPVQTLLASAIAGGATERELTGYFPTPAPLARRLVSLADVQPGHLTLEPSAGRGAIATVLAEIVPAPRLYLVELDPDHHAALVADGFRAPQLIHDDFLTTRALPERFERIVMNPPFEDQQDVRHVLHAYQLLARGGRLVAVLACSLTFRETALARELRDLIATCPDGTLTENSPDAFVPSGTSVQTVTVTLTKP